jgi:RluA family pseudouridine synthase
MTKHVLRAAAGDPVPVDDFVAARLGVPLERAAAWVRLGAVTVGGRRAAPSSRVAAGARVVVREPDAPAFADLPVVYRDDDLLVLDKPAGALSQPSPGVAAPSVEARIQAEHPGARLAHRLDRDTSGLLVFTLRPGAHAAMQQAFSGGTVERVYLAVAAGEIAAPLDVRLRIGRHPSDPRLRAALPEHAPGGRAARTDARPLGRHPLGTLLRVLLHSGRTHQIRVHLAALGHPVAGDTLYGGPPAPRLMLHATELAFAHPRTGAPLRFHSPPPPDFAGR